jgi:hypothetical protein
MLETPFMFEADFTSAEFELIGRLILRWSHIDHVLGNCLKTMLGLTDEQAVYIVFPLSLDHRMSHIDRLSKTHTLNPNANTALQELRWLVKGIQVIRNNAVHAVVARNDAGIHKDFELRSKERKLSKEQIFASDELTNYAAHAALAFRVWLGGKIEPGPWHALPTRPSIPASLQTFFQVPRPSRKEQRRSRQSARK